MFLGTRTLTKKKNFKNQCLVTGSQEWVMLWFTNIFTFIQDVLVGCEMSPYIPICSDVFTYSVVLKHGHMYLVDLVEGTAKLAFDHLTLKSH